MSISAPSTWLATYPKSGTTWVRFLLHHLLFGPVRTSADLSQRVPSIHESNEGWRGVLAQGGILNTHKAYDHHVARYPHLQGFVHVVRHPADVWLSEARFFCLTQASAVARAEGSVDSARLDTLFQEFLTVLLHRGQAPKNGRLGIGDWGHHTTSWLDARGDHPALLVRYEDLTTDPEAQLLRLAQFFGRQTTPDQRREIVDACSADALRRMEEHEIAARLPGRFYEAGLQEGHRLGLRFVGRGRIGDGLKMGPAALSRLAGRFGPTMDRLGYEITTSVPRPLGVLTGFAPLPTPAAAY